MDSFPETEIDPKQLYRKFLLSGCLKRPHLRIFEIDKLESGSKITLLAGPSSCLVIDLRGEREALSESFHTFVAAAALPLQPKRLY